MSLSRPHVFVAGETLEASEANGEIDNIINNPVPLLNLSSTNVGGLIYLSGAAQLSSMPAPSAGQIMVGTSGGIFTPANLTAGSNVTITEGSGTITIAAASGGSITVEESDGSPSITSVTKIKADQTTGLTVTSGGAGIATLAIGTVPVAYGGTGIGTATSNGVVMGNVTGGFKVSAGGTANQVFRVGTSGTQGAFGQLNLASSAAVTGALATTNGGTGLSSTPADGQLLIGNGNGFTLANLTAGSGITVTNGDGAITLAATSPTSSLITYDLGGNSVGNTASETTLLSMSVPGNTLGNNGQIECIMHVRVTDQAATLASRTLSFRMGYGGQFTDFMVIPTSKTDGATVDTLGANRVMVLRGRLMGDGATNTQVGVITMDGYSTISTVLGAFLMGASAHAADNTAMTVDSTSSQTFVINVQWSAAEGNCGIVLVNATLRSLF